MIISIIKIGLLASLTGIGGGIFNIIKNSKGNDLEKDNMKKDKYLKIVNRNEDGKLYTNIKKNNTDLNREQNLSMNREYQYINNKILEKETLDNYKKEIQYNINICDIEIKELNGKLENEKDINEKEEILDHLDAVQGLKAYWIEEEEIMRNR